MNSAAEQHDAVNLLSRLDRVPLGRSLWLIVILLTLAWIIEGFDTSIIGPMVVLLTPLWHLQASQVGVVATIGTLGIVIGLIPAGRLADRFGRRTVLCWGIAVFCLATLASGVAQNFAQFVPLRFIAGLAEGAVFPVPYLMLSEFVNRHRRAFAVGCALLGLSVGNVLPTLITRFALASYGPTEAWRVPLVIGGLLIVIVPLVLLWVPESPRFLLQRDQPNRVRDMVLRFEGQAGLGPDTSLQDPAIARALAETKADGLAIVRPPYLSRSLIAYSQLFAIFIGFYLFGAYGPTILKLLGMTTGNALLFIAVGGGIGGLANFLQGVLAERFGRRRVQAVYVALQVIGLIVLGMHVAIGVLAVAFVVYNIGAGNFTLGKLYVAEQYPTELRSTGAATGETTARFLAGVVLAFFIPQLLKSWGPETLFVVLGIVMLLLVAPMVFVGRETAGVSIDIAGSKLPAAGTDTPPTDLASSG